MKRVVLVLALSLPIIAVAAVFGSSIAAYQRGDFPTALKDLRSLARPGHAQARVNLGLMYASHSHGLSQQNIEARKSEKKAEREARKSKKKIEEI